LGSIEKESIMALPKLNDVPMYTTVIPSTGKQVKYRPFLVKEQKVLMMAYESKDQTQIINAILGTIEACTENLSIKQLTNIDADYIFTNIRAKSVGESVSLILKCSECEDDIPFQFDLNNVKVPEIDSRSKTIEISDTLKVIMKIPSYLDLIENGVLSDKISETEGIINYLVSCMEFVQTEEENISMKDEPLQEKINFIEYLTVDQFEKLSLYMGELPRITYSVDVHCPKCGHQNKRNLEGIDNFF
jgi:hypothetical protein